MDSAYLIKGTTLVNGSNMYGPFCGLPLRYKRICRFTGSQLALLFTVERFAPKRSANSDIDFEILVIS